MPLNSLKQFSISTLLALKEYIVNSGGILALITGFMYGMSSINLALIFLGICIGIDFITGVTASWYKWREEGKPKIADGYTFSSKKARETVKKFVSYGTAIILSYILAVVTMKNPEITLLGMPPKTIPEITVIILIGIEAFSVLENLKKMDIDLIGSIKNISKQGWDLFRNVKKGEF